MSLIIMLRRGSSSAGKNIAFSILEITRCLSTMVCGWPSLFPASLWYVSVYLRPDRPPGIQGLTEVGDEVGGIFNGVGIVFHAGFEQGYQHMISGGETPAAGKDFLHRFVERGAGQIAYRPECRFQNKRYRFKREIIHHEIGIGHDTVVGFDVAGAHFDFFNFFVFLNVDFQKIAPGGFPSSAHIVEVNPDDIFSSILGEYRGFSIFLFCYHW